MRQLLWKGILLLTALAMVTGCGKESPDQPRSGVTLTIVSGSENKSLEPMIRAFEASEGVRIKMEYLGSVDMTLALMEQGKAIPYDAIWPANSIWISLGDTQHAVSRLESIMRSPVVLGVRKSLAERLGWMDRPVTISTILEAVDNGRLRFAMTSATQSNSGASAYLGFLHALAGSPDVLEHSQLESPEVQEQVKRMLSRVDRSSGSSGWLMESLVDHYDRYQAMFNYEAMIIEANQALIKKGREPLYVIYPSDGMMIADSPLGYIDKGDPKKLEAFEKFQAYLLSEAVQDQIQALGRRTGLVGMGLKAADKTVFNPDWGIDIDRIISPIPTPRAEVIRLALDLYQTTLRKPSLTAYVIDVSGSMEGDGIQNLKAAMSTLLDPVQARRYMLQASPRDLHIIVPFNSEPLPAKIAHGNDPDTLADLTAFVNRLTPKGGTDIYQATVAAMGLIQRTQNLENYFPAVILMTDGRSEGNIDQLRHAVDRLPGGVDIPVFSITFGDADESQLKAISEITYGRVFQGTNLVAAFRKAKGYN